MKFEEVEAPFVGEYPSRYQPSRPGSYGVIWPEEPIQLAEEATIAIRVQPWLLDARRQVVLTLDLGLGSHLAVVVRRDGSGICIDGLEAHVPAPMLRKQWYELRLLISPGCVSLRQTPLSLVNHQSQSAEVTIEADIGRIEGIVLAAEPAGSGRTAELTSYFNGRLEDLLISRVRLDSLRAIEPDVASADLLAWWDFSADVSSTTLTDCGARKIHGYVCNLPTRGVRGSRWTGEEMCWRHAPREYASIHFHEDDLYDCGWETDFEFVVPSSLRTGVYGIRLRGGSYEDIIPVFVRPPAGDPQSKVAVLFPTMTYQIYANFPRGNFDDAYRKRMDEWNAYSNHPAVNPQFGRSTYDLHPDGSGICYSSSRRPLLTMRPGYIAYVDPNGSGLRHFPADMHLVDWLHQKGIAFDVLTDHDVDLEGPEALAPYSLVLTTTHPEYQTKRTLDSIEGYVRSYGSLAYLGGNGFYWKIANSTRLPDVLEIRRAEGGARMWESDTGEYYHALDGSYGGLWLRNDRPPQKLVGVGMSSQGGFAGSYYRRTKAADELPYAWVLDGIEDEVLGDFGLSGGGAAGFELDCVDQKLGTPEDAVVLATSENHSADFICVPEKIFDLDSQSLDYQKSQIRADICIVPKSDGRLVFSVGSITFCGSLSHGHYTNNISRMLENVVRRFV
jgi:N,N-dimethylformamidase